MPALAPFVSAIEPDTSPRLIGPAAWEKIRSASSMLPGGLARYLFGFECPLGREAASADLQVSVGPRYGGRALLTGTSLAEHLPSAELDHFAWQKVRALAELWSDEAAPEHQALDCLWLEFDLDGPAEEAPRPSLFFGPVPAPVGSGQAERRLTGRLLDLLHHPPLAADALATLDRCWAELPERAIIFQVGLMLPRLTGRVRLCLRRIAPRAIPDYLKAVGWPGRAGELAELIDQATARFDDISLTFDAGEEIGPNVGLECYFKGKAQPGREPRWEKALDWLAGQGLGRADKAEAFLRYPRRLDLPPGLAEEAEPVFRPDRITGALRGLHHLKLTHRPGLEPTAKGYTWAGFIRG